MTHLKYFKKENSVFADEYMCPTLTEKVIRSMDKTVRVYNGELLPRPTVPRTQHTQFFLLSKEKANNQLIFVLERGQRCHPSYGYGVWNTGV